MRRRRFGRTFTVALAIVLATGCASGSSPVPSGAAATGPLGSVAPGSPAPVGSPVASESGGTPSGGPPSGPLEVSVAVAVNGFDAPLEIADPGDGSGRLFVAEQAGRIRIVQDGALADQPFLDITDRIASGGERGLLGLAFHPDFPTDPRFFVDYTDRDGNTVISYFRVNATGSSADADSEVLLMHITQPFANHNGGGIVFGPDGMLYIGTGDGGSGGDPQGNGQRLDTYLGKILRIDVDVPGASAAAYEVPPDNPFAATPEAKPEIWHYGLRNPWRIRFDRETDDLWIGDVGQNAWEEIDVSRAGQKGLNYGWNTMEATHCFNPRADCDPTGLVLPLAEYDHSLGCAVIGGVVVRDRSQGRLNGRYLFGDSCSDNLWLMDPAGEGLREAVIVNTMGRSLSSIGDTEDGVVFATSLSSGELLRISASVP